MSDTTGVKVSVERAYLADLATRARRVSEALYWAEKYFEAKSAMNAAGVCEQDRGNPLLTKIKVAAFQAQGIYDVLGDLATEEAPE